MWIVGEGVRLYFVDEEMKGTIGSPGGAGGFFAPIIGIGIGNANKAPIWTVIDHLVGQGPVVWWRGGYQ